MEVLRASGSSLRRHAAIRIMHTENVSCRAFDTALECSATGSWQVAFFVIYRVIVKEYCNLYSSTKLEFQHLCLTCKTCTYNRAG